MNDFVLVLFGTVVKRGGMRTHPGLSLIEHPEQLPDPRVRGRCEHDLVDVLMIALCCLLCGGETFNDMEDFGYAKADWFKTFLRLRSGIPTHDTFNRVLAALKPEAFMEVFMAWTQTLRTRVSEEIVALDGKALRRALDQGDSPRVIVSAWAATQVSPNRSDGTDGRLNERKATWEASTQKSAIHTSGVRQTAS